MNKGKENKNINKEMQMQRNFQRRQLISQTLDSPTKPLEEGDRMGAVNHQLMALQKHSHTSISNFKLKKTKIVNSKLLPASRKCNPSLHSDHIEQLLKFLLTCDDIYKSAEAHAHKRMFTPKTFYDH